MQNHCIEGERGGWSWCESCGSALGFLAAAASFIPFAGTLLKGMSPELSLGFCVIECVHEQLAIKREIDSIRCIS